MGYLTVAIDALDATDVIGAQAKAVALTGSVVFELEVREEIERLKR